VEVDGSPSLSCLGVSAGEGAAAVMDAPPRSEMKKEERRIVEAGFIVWTVVRSWSGS